MDAAALLASLPDARERILFERLEPAREGERSSIEMPPAIAERLLELGIPGLWRHQADGVRALREGASIIVATGTASGKSLVYQLAIAETVLADPVATHLLLFPTKALAHDQLARLHAWKIPGLVAGVYDGDTPNDERAWLRQRANVLLTNPDMLHAGILAFHDRWAGFLRNLSLVIVDEAHVYRGLFGAHVALVLRRLRRLAALRGASPRFACSSATIGNPAEHAATLLGLEVRAIVEDASARGARVIAAWEPPADEDDPAARRSTLAETASLLARTIERGASTLAFVRSRRAAEVVADAAGHALGAPGRVAAYRAGYLPEERRDLERRLLTGDLDGVAATTALELGIDVGGLDAIVVAGFPGTRAAFRQQLGRAGRGSRDALGIFVVDDDPLDRYLAANPAALLDEPPEACVADPANTVVLSEHLACAAFEAPLRRDDDSWFTDGYVDAARDAVSRGLLSSRDGVLRYAGRGIPHRDRGLRGSGTRIQIVEAVSGRLLGDASVTQAMRSLHDGAIYLHQRDSFEVRSLDLEQGVALVEASDAPWYTQARSTSDLDVLDVGTHEPFGGARRSLGRVRVTERVVSYARRRIGSGALLDQRALDLPEQVLETVAVWFTIPDAVLGAARIGPADLPGALHAAEHAAIGLLPLFVACDRWDVGGLSTPLHQATNAATIFIYDGMEGGAGYARIAFERAHEHLSATLDRLRACGCARGCPSCVQSPKCGNGNEPLDKDAAVRLLATLLA
jgi:DEAD/DEAH box helicase domain-containing protein